MVKDTLDNPKTRRRKHRGGARHRHSNQNNCRSDFFNETQEQEPAENRPGLRFWVFGMLIFLQLLVLWIASTLLAMHHDNIGIKWAIEQLGAAVEASKTTLQLLSNNCSKGSAYRMII